MRKIFFILAVLSLNLIATTFNIESLNKDRRIVNILENYLYKTNFKVKNTAHINFYLGTKKDIKNIDKSLYKEISQFENDGFIIKVKENSVFIIGKNKRSTLYGVYQFLEKNLQYKFLSKNFEIIPKETLVDKNTFQFKSQARFKYREIFIKELENTEFASKLLLNGSFGHKARRRSDFFINTYNQFTPFELIKPKYKELYSQFFCAGQLDFALSDVKRFANSNFQNKLRNYKNREEDIFYIQHEDIQSFCNSINSSKLIKKYGSNSAPFLDYVNYIAKENPTKNIFFEAYQWSRKAPKTFPKLSANLDIFFSDIEANFAKPITQEENRIIYKDLLSWEKYKKEVYIWHYITNFNGYFQPFPNILSTAKDIKTFSKLNMVNGIFLQGAYETNFSDLSNLRAWVFSKLLWNPNLDEDKLIQEFSYYYYGNAYKEVLEYLEALEKEIKKTNSKLLVKTSVNEKYLNSEFIIKAKTILDKALSKVKKDSIYYKHLIEIYAMIDYVQLLKGTISQKDKKRLKKFLEENKIKYFAEGRDISSLLPYFNIKREKPKLPQKIKGSESFWLDFQEYELKLCCTKTVEDKEASSLSAVRMDGNRSDWGIQLDLANIPKGKWKIYANIRIETSKNLSTIDYIKPAIYYGIRGKGIKNLSLISSLKDEKYKEVLIGKIELEDNETGQIWIRPPESKSVKYIYVDRIFIIKE